MVGISGRDSVRRAAGAVLVAALCAVAGCSRVHYFRQANEEARALVLQKAQDPQWYLPDFSIESDPRSRYHTPYDPVFPPMPPDDPASHRYMHLVDQKEGWEGWHRYGDIQNLENPCWREILGHYVELTPQGEIVLGLEEAVRLSLIHSPEWQQQLETLYLSALDVSTERFRFDTQFFGGADLTFEHLGQERGPGGEVNRLEVAPNLSLERRFATAGELLVGFANSTVFSFAGPNFDMTSSLLNFSFVQPLLRAGGRVIALEQLTIAERTLLANVRAFQYWRQGFFTQVAIGDQGVQGPSRRGGFFGGTGLTGFSGQGSGGFGGVGEATGFGRGFGGGGGAGAGGGATTGFAGGGAGTVGGFIGLLQQQQQIRNNEAALNAQLRTLALLEANLAAGLIDIAQVDQFRQSIETERATLLQARNGLQAVLENYKTNTLGLPPDLPMVLDDQMIEQFQFIAPGTTEVQNRIADFLDEFGELPEAPSVEQLQEAFDRIAELGTELAERFTAVRADLEAFDERADARMRQMEPAERSLFEADRRRLVESLMDLETEMEEAAQLAEELRSGLTSETVVQTANGMVALASQLLNIVQELSLIQARARLESITLDPVELDSYEALAIARANRLDWMNNRANLVDTWRLIEFNANALRSQLDIRISGDMGTIRPDNPLSFRGEDSRVVAQLLWDAPLTRLIERNNFRQQLIFYQQSRRQLIRYEDGIHRNLRNILRQLELLEVNLEIQRRAVAIAIRRVDQTRENLNRPVPPPVPGEPPAQFGPTAALNLLTALSDLRASQNNLMSVWLNYYAGRMTLMRELGILQLDERGLWIDTPIELAVRMSPEECPLPPDVPAQWYDLAPEGEHPGVPPAPLPEPPATPAPGAEPAPNGPVLGPDAAQAAPIRGGWRKWLAVDDWIDGVFDRPIEGETVPTERSGPVAIYSGLRPDGSGVLPVGHVERVSETD